MKEKQLTITGLVFTVEGRRAARGSLITGKTSCSWAESTMNRTGPPSPKTGPAPPAWMGRGSTG